MADVYKGLTIKIGADTSKLSTALNSVKKTVSGTSKELTQLSRALKVDPTNASLLARQQEVYARKIEASSEKLKLLRQAEEEVGQANMSNEQWTKLQADIAMTEADIEKFKEALEESKDALSKLTGDTSRMTLSSLGDGFEEAGEKIKETSAKIEQVGGTLTRSISLPMAAAATATVAAAVNIDDALTSVKKTVDGTEEDYNRLKEAAIEFSKTNAVDAATMLELDALGAQLGFTIDELQLFGEVASGLDIATNMDAETAATEMAQFANITKMAHDDIGNYASAIVNLGNNMATTEKDISSMSQRVAAASHQVGMSEADILGWSAAMSSLGIEAEAGGTAFSTCVSQIDTAVAKGSKSLESYAALSGLTAEEFKQAWGQDASATFQRILQGVAASDNMSVALEAIGVSGVRATDIMKRLAGNTELVNQAVSVSNAGWQQNLALGTEVENRNSSLSSSFAILKNKATAVAAEVGQPLAEALTDAIDAAEPLIDILEDGAKAFSSMDKEEQKAVISAAAAVAALGPLLTVAGKVGGGIGTVANNAGAAMKALDKFGTAAGNKVSALSKMGGAAGKLGTALAAVPFGPAAVGVAALTAAVAIGVVAWNDYCHEMEQNEKAAKSLSDLQSEAQSSIKGTATELDKTSGSSKNLTKSLEETTAKAKELRDAAASSADGFEKNWAEALGSGTQLDDYLKAIDNLTSKTTLTREEQERLKVAVDLYNKATGDSVEIVDAQAGKLSKTTEELHANTAAMLKNAKAAAYQDLITESYKQQAEAVLELGDANAQLESAQKKLEDAYQLAAAGGDQYGYAVMAASAEVDKAQKNVDTLQKTIDSSNDRIADATNALVGLEEEEKKTNNETGALTRVLGYMGDQTKAACETAGGSLSGYANKLYAAGVRASELKDITDAEFAEMVRQTGGDIDAMKKKIDEYNSKKILKKTMEVDTSDLKTALQTLHEINNTPLKGKAFSVPAGSQVFGQNAAGGIAIPKHADGGILTQATLTSAGWVGEDGWEAIVPLSNARYVKPFAQAVAAEVNAAGGNSGDSVQIVLNGAVLNDTEAMKQTTQDFLVAIMRKAGMNRG